MSVVSGIANPFLGAFASGLVFGLAYCTASCLPVVAGYIAGIGSGFKQSVRLTLVFNAGRVVAYSLIGALIGMFGGVLTFFVSEEAIAPFQVYASVAFGLATAAIGVYLMLQVRKTKTGCECSQPQVAAATNRMQRYGVDFGAFTLGFTRGLIICAPLILLLSTSFTLVDAAGSVGIAFLFGLGTTISPILLLGGVTGWLLNKAPLFRKWISIAGGIVLLLMGIVSVYTALTQVI
jgi:sulfite exporter TauE/SafE